jgi:N-acyl homoserine lactone hydrolase
VLFQCGLRPQGPGARSQPVLPTDLSKGVPVSELHPVRLYLLRIGGGVMSTEPPVSMSVGAYLVQMSDGRNVLIDTGYPPGWQTRGPFSFLKIESDVVSELSKLGLKPDDIGILLTTHFDPDHIGMNDALPNAEIVAHREGWEQALAGERYSAMTRQHWNSPGLKYRLLDGDAELLPGLDLISTPGHAPGHLSVLIHLPRTGKVLLAIDAISMANDNTPNREMTFMDFNLEDLRASTVKLQELAIREHPALFIFGHDGNQWDTLKIAPAFYD